MAADPAPAAIRAIDTIAGRLFGRHSDELASSRRAQGRRNRERAMATTQLRETRQSRLWVTRNGVLLAAQENWPTSTMPVGPPITESA